MKNYEAINREWTATATVEELNAKLEEIAWYEFDLKMADRLRPDERKLEMTLAINKNQIKDELNKRG